MHVTAEVREAARYGRRWEQKRKLRKESYMTGI